MSHGIESGELLSDVRFADDQGMLASSETDLQAIMSRLKGAAKKFDMRINVKKTKTMVVSRGGGKSVNIVIDGQKVEQVKKFRYLGALISDDGRCLDEVKTRIALGKDAFNK